MGVLKLSNARRMHCEACPRHWRSQTAQVRGAAVSSSTPIYSAEHALARSSVTECVTCEHAIVLRITSRGRAIAAACLEALRAASGDDSLRRRNDCDFRRPPQNHNVDVIGCPAGVRQGTSGPTYDGLGSAQFRAWRPGQRRQGERLR